MYKMAWINTNSVIYYIESVREPVFEDMVTLVGGHIVRTLCVFEGTERIILVDEEGEHKDLDLNYNASQMCDQVILGNALILVNFELE